MFCLSYPEKIKLQALRCLRDWRQMDNVLCDLFCTEDRRVYEKKAQILLDLAFGELLEKQASYLFGNLYKQGVRFNPKTWAKSRKNVLNALGITEAEEAAQSVSRGVESASKGMGGKDVGGGKAAPTGSEPSTTPKPEAPSTPPGTSSTGGTGAPPVKSESGVPSPEAIPPITVVEGPRPRTRDDRRREQAWWETQQALREKQRTPPVIEVPPEFQLHLGTPTLQSGGAPAGGARSGAPIKTQVPPTGATPLVLIRGKPERIRRAFRNLNEEKRQEALDELNRLQRELLEEQQALSRSGEGVSSSSMLRSPLFWGLGLTTGLGGFGGGYFLRNSGNQNVSSQNVSSLDSHKVNSALELIRNYTRQQGYRMEPEEEGKLMDILLYLVRKNPGISTQELYNRARRTLEPIGTSQK